mmetsp:Transcript_22929/g.58539  ORF Transcript_22929/g.58539 Transcript_22929/m.58539 type:complete len:120 (+) Transcript_22929:1939-2298(+)
MQRARVQRAALRQQRRRGSVVTQESASHVSQCAHARRATPHSGCLQHQPGAHQRGCPGVLIAAVCAGATAVGASMSVSACLGADVGGGGGVWVVFGRVSVQFATTCLPTEAASLGGITL